MFYEKRARKRRFLELCCMKNDREYIHVKFAILLDFLLLTNLILELAGGLLIKPFLELSN